ncbi:MAG: methyl-accepting chemotaxis protein, partial [Phenylobacterium sp.]
MYRRSGDQIISNSQSFLKEDALAQATSGSAVSFDEANNKLVEVINQRTTMMQRHADDADEIVLSAKTLIVATVILITLIAVGSGFLMGKSITSPVNKLLFHFKEFAEGKLTIDCAVDREDELGQVLNGFNGSVKALAELMSQINMVAVQVASAAEQFTAISGETSRNIESQQSETEQVLELVSKMTDGTKTVFSSAQSAQSSALQCQKQSQDGTVVVGDTISNITELVEMVEQAQG